MCVYVLREYSVCVPLFNEAMSSPLHSVSVRESNFPPEILEVVKGQAVDLALRCVQPPAMKKKE